jgi:prepilin-type N-terminal cleavage/methylation domain-containing protein
VIAGLRDRGFSLVEVILAMVLIAAAFVSISLLLSTTTLHNVNLDVTTRTVLLARQKMDEVTAKDFADVVPVGQTNFSGNFGNYSFQVGVEYVEPADLDTPVVGPTDYKRIRVIVTASGWNGFAMLYGLRTTAL